MNGMLARYRIHRGKRPADDPLPDGVRQDTRKHTRHFLRPDAEAVAEFLANPDAEAWERFAEHYQNLLTERFEQNPTPFDDLASLAGTEDVHLGCSCPTAKNPDVNHCHTVLALRFFEQHYPDLDVRLPG